MDVAVRQRIRPSSNDLWFLAYLPLAISDGIATPLIPLLALQKFGASALVVTMVIAASGVSQVPFTILWGNLSDRVAHRKYFLVGSFVATGVSVFLISLANDLSTFFWFNVVEGLASAASAPIGTMLLLETRHKRWWPEDIGLFGLISGLGTTIGLALGFLLLFVLGFGEPPVMLMTQLLWVSGALALFASAIAWAWIEEPTVRIERRSVSGLLHLQRGVIERLRHVRSRVLGLVDLTRPTLPGTPRREYWFLGALAVMTVGFSVFYGPFPVFLFEQAKFSDAAVFIAYLGSSAASTALFFHSGRAVERHSPKNVFLASLGGRVVLFLLFLWAPAYAFFGVGTSALVGWLTLLNALLGVSWAFISTASTLFLIRLVGRANRGNALGLYNAIAGAGGLAGTVLGGALYSAFGVGPTYGFAAGLVIAGAALLAPIPYHVFHLSRTARVGGIGTARGGPPSAVSRPGR